MLTAIVTLALYHFTVDLLEARPRVCSCGARFKKGCQISEKGESIIIKVVFKGLNKIRVLFPEDVL